jgi:hypothetical protein
MVRAMSPRFFATRAIEDADQPDADQAQPLEEGLSHA